MQSKCFRKGCGWVLEVAHMDEALERLQQHYRAIHPTKAFYRQQSAENLEGYNITADEFCEQNALENGEGNVQYDWGYLRSSVRRWQQERDRGRQQYVNQELIDEVNRRVTEHFANNPENPENAQPENIILRAFDNIREDVAPAAVDVVPPFEVLDPGHPQEDVLVDAGGADNAGF